MGMYKKILAILFGVIILLAGTNNNISKQEVKNNEQEINDNKSEKINESISR